eukprot:3254891-Ditylum_brightwellii.AAC.1
MREHAQPKEPITQYPLRRWPPWQRVSSRQLRKQHQSTRDSFRASQWHKGAPESRGNNCAGRKPNITPLSIRCITETSVGVSPRVKAGSQ